MMIESKRPVQEEFLAAADQILNNTISSLRILQEQPVRNLRIENSMARAVNKFLCKNRATSFDTFNRVLGCEITAVRITRTHVFDVDGFVANTRLIEDVIPTERLPIVVPFSELVRGKKRGLEKDKWYLRSKKSGQRIEHYFKIDNIQRIKVVPIDTPIDSYTSF